MDTQYRNYSKVGIFAPPWKYIENRDGHRRLDPFELQPWGVWEDGPRTDQSARYPDIVHALREQPHAWEAALASEPTTPIQTELDPEAIEQLRSIGYVASR